jgi:CheY-like chemotaxis protein
MSRKGPILLIEDDADDVSFISQIITGLDLKNEIINLKNGHVALEFLRQTKKQPLIILCDINMPVMSGLKLREEINNDEALKRKAIPFVFFSTSATEREVREAYDMTVQGYFQKADDVDYMRQHLKLILDYWCECKHPNNFATL